MSRHAKALLRRDVYAVPLLAYLHLGRFLFSISTTSCLLLGNSHVVSILGEVKELIGPEEGVKEKGKVPSKGEETAIRHEIGVVRRKGSDDQP